MASKDMQEKKKEMYARIENFKQSLSLNLREAKAKGNLSYIKEIEFSLGGARPGQLIFFEFTLADGFPESSDFPNQIDIVKILRDLRQHFELSDLTVDDESSYNQDLDMMEDQAENSVKIGFKIVK